MTAIAGDSIRPFDRPVRVRTTFSRGRLTIPYRILGWARMCAIHDRLVARRLPGLRDQIDVIHAWPMGALHTMRAAKELGIPVALERCNAHTRFAYEVVQRESERIGVPLPPDHEHAFNADYLRHEEAEYAEADALLCPSDFVVQTFLDQDFPRERLVRFFYGVDETRFFPDPTRQPPAGGLTMIFAGLAAVRKGLHFALEAWLASPASKDGEFLIAGEILPAYQQKLAPLLAHPSVKLLGHRNDVPELMRRCDLFVLPSIEEGFGLVCTEAMASGCVPLVSDACTELCRDDENALVHRVGDVAALEAHMTRLHEDRDALARLRAKGLETIPSITWTAAGRALVDAYRTTIDLASGRTAPAATNPGAAPTT